VATWEALFFGFIPDFGEQYAVISIMAERMPPEISPNVQTIFFMTSAPWENVSGAEPSR
jgi:hypothetical protein